ncbi:histidine kinase [Hansschlegelia sp. KR7-227]|uniref:histidine kinase n=1 Tax=Hansschlegelia sp. KR7-227 TaxID=3400914 RepID=UPI003BFFB746
MSLLVGLILRLGGVVMLCLAGASVWVMVDADRNIRAETVASAARVETEAVGLAWRELMFRGNEGSHAKFAFPDWRTSDTLRVISPGYCVSLAWTGEPPLKLCGGRRTADDGAPAWFEALNQTLFGPLQPITRTISLGGRAVGTVVAEAKTESAARQAWRQVSVVVGVAGAMALAIGVLATLAIGHALKPAETIVRGLKRLEGGDHAVRLPAFRTAEFGHIARAFNDLTARLDSTTKQRAAVTRRLFQVQEEERRSLARDLHDEFGQCLTATRALAAAVATATRADRPDVAESAREIAVISDRMATTLRGALARLRPPELDEIGLEQSLEHLVTSWNARVPGAGGRRPVFRLDVVGDLAAVPAQAALTVYRITQECLTNAAKHGEPAEVRVRVESPDAPAGALLVTVEDDGGGDPASLAGGRGHGLLGIRERVDALGGRLTTGASERGVRIAATIPLAGDARLGAAA